jgi:hypothetical protein
MVIINNISDEYFELNGIQYVKIYNPLAQGSEAISIFQIYDTRYKLINSIKYYEYKIDGIVYSSQVATISVLLGVIYNSAISEIQALELELDLLNSRVDNLEENQVTGVEVYETVADLPATGTLLVSYKVSNDPTPSNNGYYHWSGSVYVQDYSLAAGEIEVGNVEAISGEKSHFHYKTVGVFNKALIFNLGAGEVSIITGVPNASTNWLHSGYMDVLPSTDYTIWGYSIAGSSKNQRIIYLDNSDDVISVESSDNDKTYTFTTPANCVKLIIQIASVSGVALDIPNSLYWDTFNIVKGERSYVKGSSINGDIETDQITEIEDIAKKIDSTVDYNYINYNVATTTGAISASTGAVVTEPTYKRMSVTNPVNMVEYTGQGIVYSGEIDNEIYAGVCYYDNSLIFLGYEFNEAKTYNRQVLSPPENTKYIAACSLTNDPILEKIVLKSSAGTSIYVDASVGSSGDGSLSLPYKTITEAILDANNDSVNNIIIKEGDYREVLNLSGLGIMDLNLIAADGERIRILGSDQLTGWVLVSGNTYKTFFNGVIPSFSRMDDPIFEDGNPSKPISNDERHPLQKSLSNRLPYSLINAVADIATVNTTPASYYYDEVNDEIYIHTSDSDNPNTNGFSYELPQRVINTSNTSDNEKATNLKFKNIQFMFASIGLVIQGFGFVERYNCVSLGHSGAGGFRDDNAKLIIAYYDEAGGCDNDGINGHFDSFPNYDTLTDNRSMQPNVIYIEPWCHDNYDDGLSHHENHNVRVEGGLCEYNDDGGIRGSNDANYIVLNYYGRKNGLVSGLGEGLAAVNPTLNPNRNGVRILAFNCLLEDNEIGVSAISQSDNSVELINCIVRNNNIELKADYGKIISRNTKYSNTSGNIKVETNGGSIDIKNDSILT